MAKDKHEIDMCSGPLLGKILLFTIPLMLSGILQLLFNAADVIVVGNYVGESALAAVGSTTSLIMLLINVFIGFSVGTNVLVARYYGGKQEEEVQETLHTSLVLAVICGAVLVVIGTLLSRPLLSLMGTPDNVLGQAALYMRIYFLGMPAFLLYNFGSAILRAVGDTRRPLYFLTGSGIVNVILNISFIRAFGMGVEGVALATIISQAISAVLVMQCLIKREGALRMEPSKLRITKDKLWKIMRIGLPAGTQGAVFSLSNVLIQSSINSFGSIAMAGSTAAANIEGFVYTSMNACYQTAVSFISQNMGAKRFDRIRRVAFQCILLVIMIGVGMGLGAYLAGEQLLGIYSSEPEVIRYGLERMAIVCAPYFLCGIMDTLVGCIRGLGYSVLPMIVSMLGACGLRILWIYTVFRRDPTWNTLFFSYPVTWTVTASTHLICFWILFRRQKRLLAG